MGLLDEIRSEAPGAKPCKVARHLAAMDKKDAADIQAALDDPAIPTMHISTVLTRHGWTVGPMAVSKHREKTCCCVTRG